MLKNLLNLICLPFRLTFSHEVVNHLGLDSMRDERNNMILKNARGKLLDIGCGYNQIVHKHGQESVGIDVYDFGADALIVKNSADLPFEDGSFETVCFVASLNHIPNRVETLQEANRVLKPGGLLLITMLTPIIGVVRHKLAWWDEDQHERGMKEGEEMGLSANFIKNITKEAGFTFVKCKPFVLGLNRLYIFEKKPLVI